MKTLLSLMIVLLFIQTQPAWGVRVCNVHDGDTVTLCNGTKVRLWGVDAPEIKQPFGPEARDYLVSIVQKKDVKLYCTQQSFQRLVCSLYKEGRSVNRLMVLGGFAFDNPEFSHGHFRRSEKQAQSEGVGVWVLPDGGERPWVYRHKGKKAS